MVPSLALTRDVGTFPGGGSLSHRLIVDRSCQVDTLPQSPEFSPLLESYSLEGLPPRISTIQ